MSEDDDSDEVRLYDLAPDQLVVPAPKGAMKRKRERHSHPFVDSLMLGPLVCIAIISDPAAAAIHEQGGKSLGQYGTKTESWCTEVCSEELCCLPTTPSSVICSALYL